MTIDNAALYGTEWWLERPRDEASQSPGDGRRPIERDRDRITHSAALRRLASKTQVIGSPWADGFRNRLTHTLEVSQVGRSIAARHHVDEALVEASCLGHDLGHPPFGHAGERRLNELMAGHGGFDANAQTLRVLQTLETKSSGTAGLNLTRATYWSIMKYPYRREGRLPAGPAVAPSELTAQSLEAAGGDVRALRKFVYDEDLEQEVRQGQSFAAWLSDNGTIPSPAHPTERLKALPTRTLACQIMDWADDVAYAIHDFEDAVLAGFITAGAITRAGDELREVVRGDVGKFFDVPSAFDTSYDAYTREIESVLLNVQGHADVGRRLRPETRKLLGKLIDGASVESPEVDDETTVGYRVHVDRDDRLLVSLLARLGFELMIRDERVVRYLRKGTMMLERAFNELMDDPKVVDERVGQLLPRDMASVCATANERMRARTICDFLASMSESGLTRFYQTVFESTGGSPFE